MFEKGFFIAVQLLIVLESFLLGYNIAEGQSGNAVSNGILLAFWFLVGTVLALTAMIAKDRIREMFNEVFDDLLSVRGVLMAQAECLKKEEKPKKPVRKQSNKVADKAKKGKK